jgi:type IV secretory pathway TrbL component
MALLLLSGLCGTMTVTVIAAASVRCVLTVRAGAVRMTVHNSVPAAGAVGSPLNAADRQEACEERSAN